MSSQRTDDESARRGFLINARIAFNKILNTAYLYVFRGDII